MTQPPPDNTADLRDLDQPFNTSSGSDVNAGYAPGSTTPWPTAPAPVTRSPSPPAIPTAPPMPSSPPDTRSSPTPHPALGPQFIKLHAAAAVAQTVKRAVAAQAKAGAAPTSHIRSTTGWQRS